MKKISVKICTGTACYVMGGCDFLELPSALSESLLTKVEIAGTNCLGLCKEVDRPEELKYPPFVMINEKVYSPSSLGHLIELVTEEVKLNE
ncbi:MAG: hypothetical protein JXR63_07665 [Spirochaetales bacterium]|nr:hypothetical protein [Spirochaetales bacterium]